MDNEIPLGDEQEATKVVKKKRCSMVPNALMFTFKRGIIVTGEADVSKATETAWKYLAEELALGLELTRLESLFDVKVSQVK